MIQNIKKINLKIEGDYELGKFTIFLVVLERGKIRLPIFLTAEQTNLGIESDDPFEPIKQLKLILLRSGFSIFQTIEIMHGDESCQQLEFEANFNETSEEGFKLDIQPINLKYTNLEDPKNGNIELQSRVYSEKESMRLLHSFSFIIYTQEEGDSSLFDTMKMLKIILR